MKGIFCSNQLQYLLENLKKKLFLESSKSNNLIFVQNDFVKDWIKKRFCDDESLKVAFDLKIINFSNFLNFIQNSLNTPKEKRFLNYLELNLIIREKILFSIFNNSSHYPDLTKYILKDNKILEKRLCTICNELTHSFINYSVYGNENDLNLKRKTIWQASLFFEIFYLEEYALPYRDLKNFNVETLENFSFHFFSINHIPSLYFDFINRFSQVFHYVTSPTNVFWEDITSDYERHKIKKYWIKKGKAIEQIFELDSYLKDRNTLLANMEKIKKRYFSIISSYDDYYFYDEFLENKSDSFLNFFQKDILNLENRDQNNLGMLNKKDFSIQIHIASNKFREVQILHSNILNLLSNDKDLSLCDIHVIAPDVNEYVSYIHMIFNDIQNPLNYKINDLSLSNESYLIKGIEKFFSLAKSKWEKSDIINLFENPLFKKKNNFSDEELVTLINLLDNANISHGLNEKHISNFLENKIQLKALLEKSFEKGLSRIISSMVFILSNEFQGNTISYDFPFEQLDLSNCSLILDKFISIMCSISDELKIIEEDKELSLLEWRVFLRKIINNYFLIDDSSIEKSAYDVCDSFFHDLKKIEFRFERNLYLFETIFNHLKKYFERGKTTYNLNNQEAIYFSSFNIAPLPAKAIFILGLDSDSIKFYPRNSQNIDKFDEIPSENDLKRSLFLEAILSAKKYLILSCPSSNNFKIDASILLQEFIFYLDNSYKIMEKKPTEFIIQYHPSVSFDKEYFGKDRVNFSKLDFLAAKSFYYKNPKSVDKQSDSIKPLPEVIDINALRLLSKNPIKFYLNKALEIYLDDEKKENEFTFSGLDKYIINQASLKYNLDEILKTYEKKADIPLGIYYEIEREKIVEENEKLFDNFKTLGICKADLHSIEFKLNINKVIEVEENYFQLPPIEIKIKDKKIKLIGKLQNVTKKGLVLFSDDKLSDIVRCWGDILIFHTLNNDFSKQLLFLKSSIIKSYGFNDINKHLEDYIEYYSKCLNEPSFMIKSFIEHILHKDENGLSKAINNLYDDKILSLDVSTKWFLRNFKNPAANEIINRWSDYSKNIFKPILEEI